MRLRRPTALHFNRCQPGLSFHDEVDFLTSLAPIVNLTLAGSRGIRQVRADR